LKTSRSKHHWFWRLCLITVAAAVVIAAVLLILIRGSTIDELQAGIASYHFPLTALRLGVIAMIAAAWPRLVHLGEQIGGVGIDRSVELAAMRWRVLAWLCAIELIIGQNVLWWLLAPAGGVGA